MDRTVAWRRKDIDAGLGMVRLEQAAAGWSAHGNEVIVDGQRRWSVTFRVDVDEVWHTRRAEVSVVADDGRRGTVLESDAAGSWRQDGRSIPELDGCLDIDIAATPFTNTLPMRRLKLDVGEEAAIDAAWLGIPDLELERADQIYQRLSRNAEGLQVWRYALPGGPAYTLTVDDDAIVVDYESFATKIDG